VARSLDVLSAEPLVGLKPPRLSDFVADLLAFSRTPRGFEAKPFITGSSVYDRLSAEPLVGLKLVDPLLADAQYQDFQPNPSWV